jgi:hypothetical protein
MYVSPHLGVKPIIHQSELGTCSSLLTSNIEYGDIMIGFFSILQHFPQNSIKICFHIIFSHWLSKLDVQMYCYSQIILFVDFKYRIWWYHDWIFFNPTTFCWYILIVSVRIHVQCRKKVYIWADRLFYKPIFYL